MTYPTKTRYPVYRERVPASETLISSLRGNGSLSRTAGTRKSETLTLTKFG